MKDVFTDLVDEGNELDAVVSGLSPEEWNTPTPAPGWTVADQIAHLAFIANLAGLAAVKDQAFLDAAAAARDDFQGAVNANLAAYRKEPDLLGRWRKERAFADQALAAVPAGETVPWLVNPLPPSVLAAAGLLELFAHGQDVRDALGVEREYTDRVGHLAFFGSRTRDFGYVAHGLTPPAEEFRFELTAPSGILWTFGPEDAANKVSGPAADFALLVSRRRNRADLALEATGDEADRWLDIAQAYRGPAGQGRRPGQFAKTVPTP